MDFEGPADGTSRDFREDEVPESVWEFAQWLTRYRAKYQIRDRLTSHQWLEVSAEATRRGLTVALSLSKGHIISSPPASPPTDICEVVNGYYRSGNEQRLERAEPPLSRALAVDDRRVVAFESHAPRYYARAADLLMRSWRHR
jgi:hypothetical protein